VGFINWSDSQRIVGATVPFQGVTVAYHPPTRQLYMAWRTPDSGHIRWNSYAGNGWVSGLTLVDRSTTVGPLARIRRRERVPGVSARGRRLP
jgi:hypothetical protein